MALAPGVGSQDRGVHPIHPTCFPRTHSAFPPPRTRTRTSTIPQLTHATRDRIRPPSLLDPLTNGRHCSYPMPRDAREQVQVQEARRSRSPQTASASRLPLQGGDRAWPRENECATWVKVPMVRRWVTYFPYPLPHVYAYRILYRDLADESSCSMLSPSWSVSAFSPSRSHLRMRGG